MDYPRKGDFYMRAGYYARTGFTINYFQCKKCFQRIGVAHSIGAKTKRCIYTCTKCGTKIIGTTDIFDLFDLGDKEKKEIVKEKVIFT